MGSSSGRDRLALPVTPVHRHASHDIAIVLRGCGSPAWHRRLRKSRAKARDRVCLRRLQERRPLIRDLALLGARFFGKCILWDAPARLSSSHGRKTNRPTAAGRTMVVATMATSGATGVDPGDRSRPRRRLCQWSCQVRPDQIELKEDKQDRRVWNWLRPANDPWRS